MSITFDVSAMLTPPDILKCRRILCVQPHPDDNEIGMGGIIAVLTQGGCEAHYLTVTNGDQGNIDPTATPEQTAKTRRAEAESAGRHLGAKYFHYLDHGDGTLFDVLGLSKDIARVIREVRPDAVFCPDPWLPYECHLDHIVTGRAVSNAYRMVSRVHFPDGEETWYAAAIGYYYTASPNKIVDITDTFERKFDAVALHKSQVDAQTLAMYRFYFEMKGRELARGMDFEIGEGLKVLGAIHTHCFVDAHKI